MPEDPKPADDHAPGARPAADDPAHSESGAPTNQAHREAGDGTLVGSIPAGLSPDEMDEAENLDQSAESGTG